jgi:transcriptional regulator with GAF, ATPase, and Fis domain
MTPLGRSATVTDTEQTPVWALWLLVLLGTVQLIVLLVEGGVPFGRVSSLFVTVACINLVLVGLLLNRHFRGIRHRMSEHQSAHRATLEAVDALQLQNEILQIIGRSPDVPAAFQQLASRIVRIIPCDRLGLALLSEDGQELQTFTARPEKEDEQGARPDVVFRVDGTALGHVIRTREPLVIREAKDASAQFLDATVISGAGFHSALLIPLRSKDRAVGTLNLVSRRADAFTADQAAPVQPIAEMLAVAWMVQQLQLSLGRFRTMEAMSEITLSIAAEINSALQTVIGHCDLIQREYADERLQRDLDTVVRQADRIAKLLERMRATTHHRLNDVAASVRQEA